MLLNNQCITEVTTEEMKKDLEANDRKDTTVVNIYASNIGASQCRRKPPTTLKGENDNNTKKWGTLTPHLQQWTDHPDRNQ